MEERIEHLIQVLKDAMAKVGELQKATTAFQRLTQGPGAKEKVFKAAPAYAKQINDGLASMQSGLKIASQEAADIAKEEADRKTGAVKPDELVQHFRSVIEAAGDEARKPRSSEVAATLKGVDVEIKGLIVVEEGEARIVTPTPEKVLDPAQLSTIRMAFGTVPTRRPPAEKEGEEPEG